MVLTYNLNRLQGHVSPDPICVTLKGTPGIDEQKILRRIQYHHPVYSREALAAQKRFHEINGRNLSYFCARLGPRLSRGRRQHRLAVGQSLR